jgi:hypothetical protein
MKGSGPHPTWAKEHSIRLFIRTGMRKSTDSFGILSGDGAFGGAVRIAVGNV